jgi:hypothetical protein
VLHQQPFNPEPVPRDRRRGSSILTYPPVAFHYPPVAFHDLRWFQAPAESTVPWEQCPADDAIAEDDHSVAMLGVVAAMALIAVAMHVLFGIVWP